MESADGWQEVDELCLKIIIMKMDMIYANFYVKRSQTLECVNSRSTNLGDDPYTLFRFYQHI